MELDATNNPAIRNFEQWVRGELHGTNPKEPEPQGEPLKRLKEALDVLSDEERSELFGEYCRYCGSKDPRCQCWNDE